MDSNWSAAQSGAATGPSSGVGSDSNANLDWRSQLQPDARQRIVNKIMDTLKRHLPVPVPEGINELQKIAVRFEEKIYSAATSQPDYLRKISLNMLSMENKTQPGLNPSLPNQNRMDPGVGMTSQQPSSNPGQSLGMSQVMNQPPASRQQQPLLQGSPNMPTAGPGGPSGAAITSMSGPSISNGNPMSGPNGTSGTGGPTGSLPTDMYSNTQRRQQQQQLTPQNQMLYHQQQLVMHQKLRQQQQQHQQQQSLLQQIQMQISSALAGGSGMMSAAPTGGMQQSQLNSQQQPVGQGGSFQQQPLMRQQPQSTMPMQQTNNVTDLQQQRLQMQQNQMQQSQMQQNQMQQNQMQQNQLQPNQMQQNQMLNQQMMLGQKQNLLLGSGGAGNLNKMQRQMQMQRQAGLLQQQQQQQQQQQPQQQQHLLSQLQSQQQQLPQQQQPSMMQQREMQMPQQRMQGSPALLQTQNSNGIDPQRQQQQQFIPQQQQPQQQQRVLQDVASSPASIDSTAQTGHPGDWQEEMYQRLKYLKDTYFADLREIHQKLSIKLSQLDSIVPANARGGEQIEKMKHFKMILDRMIALLQLGKHNLQISLKDKLSLYEKQILSILQNHKKAPQQQPQAGAPSDQPHFSGLQQSQPGLQTQQLPQQQQPQQMDNQNQLQQQLSTSTMPQSNNLGMPNAMQQGMQNTLQSDQLQASGTGFGSLQQGAMGPSMQNTMNPPQMVGSGSAIGSSNMSHTVNMAGMQTNMSSAQVLKPQQQHQEQQLQTQQRMMQSQQQMQQRHLQQRFMQQKQQLLQQQLPLQQQKQPQPQQNQMQQLGQPSEPSDIKSDMARVEESKSLTCLYNNTDAATLTCHLLELGGWTLSALCLSDFFDSCHVYNLSWKASTAWQRLIRRLCW
ncbi:Mediator of RNA polymerase II transcription subunit 15a [Carex littledalei]|uniref:Mediator of RNA polymerase II transcription subunit 15a n=1 Tax=Carex littledalei TaxID=544730 RepID=A0A833VER1_9POAL|nr:Mediator of RNA polymerase II transcription subunit 15a [Carex littledalei]